MLAEIRNYYACSNDRCAHHWVDDWNCPVDDNCPDCGTRTSPYQSNALVEKDSSTPDTDQSAPDQSAPDTDQSAPDQSAPDTDQSAYPYKETPRAPYIGQGTVTPVNHIAQRVHEFGHTVLRIMEQSEEWGPDTLDTISDCAQMMALAQAGQDGTFERTPEVMPDALQYNIGE